MKKLTAEEAMRHVEKIMGEACRYCRYRAAVERGEDADELAEYCADCRLRYTVEETVGAFTDVQQGEDPAFDILWEEYPNHNGKKAAQKVFARINPDETLLTKMIAAVKTAKSSTRWQRGYIMELARWLREERYNDGAVQEVRERELYPHYEQRTYTAPEELTFDE